MDMRIYEILYEYIYIIKIKILYNFKIYQIFKNFLLYKILMFILKHIILFYLKNKNLINFNNFKNSIYLRLFFK